MIHWFAPPDDTLARRRRTGATGPRAITGPAIGTPAADTPIVVMPAPPDTTSPLLDPAPVVPGDVPWMLSQGDRHPRGIVYPEAPGRPAT